MEKSGVQDILYVHVLQISYQFLSASVNQLYAFGGVFMIRI